MIIDPVTSVTAAQIFVWYVVERRTINDIIQRLNDDPSIPLPPRCTSGMWTRLAVKAKLDIQEIRLEDSIDGLGLDSVDLVQLTGELESWLGQPIDNISRNIGINDRFFIIRELFDGESDRFTSLVNALESADSYQAASGNLKEQFAENIDHEGVEILIGLLKRRYIR